MKQTLLFILTKPSSTSLSSASLDAILTGLLLDQSIQVAITTEAKDILANHDLMKKLSSFESIGEMSIYHVNEPSTISMKSCDANIEISNIDSAELRQLIDTADKVINF